MKLRVEADILKDGYNSSVETDMYFNISYEKSGNAVRCEDHPRIQMKLDCINHIAYCPLCVLEIRI